MELLVKYIAGEASPEEAMAAEEWIQATPENKQQFDELQKVWMETGPSKAIYQHADVNKEWEVVKQTITQSRVTQMKPRRTTYLVAACMTLLAGALGWFLLKQASNNNIEMVTLQAQTVQQEQLPDQTSITLDGNSKVVYKKDFGKAARELALNGEGFFKVTHDPKKPFIIDMEGLKLQVLGTSFRVNNDKAAQTVHVDVATGRVMLFTESDTLVLNAGQSGSYDRKTQRFTLLDTVDVNNYSYATKQFSFSDTRLDKVATYLEKTYNVKLQFQNPAIKACRLSAQFDQQPIEDILDVIASTFNIHYSVKDHTIYIDGKGCE